MDEILRAMIAVCTLFHSLIDLSPTGKGKRKIYNKWRGDMMTNLRGGCGSTANRAQP